MTRKYTSLLVLLIVGVAAIAFAAAWLVRTCTAPDRPDVSIAQWLALSPQQAQRLQQIDPAFARDVADMAGQLDHARQTLAQLLEHEHATDLQILDQVEHVIDAHNALERRVAEHLVQLRGELEPTQRQRLGRHAADHIRLGLGRHANGSRADRDQPPRRRLGPPEHADTHNSIRQTIDQLFENHRQIQRHVELLPDGVLTTTTSDDPQVTRDLRLHVQQMKQRLEAGQPMRRGDPLFRELFKHHHAIQMHIQDVPGGVQVRQTSADPQVVMLIHSHADVVSQFIEQGPPRQHQITPLPDGYQR